MMHPVGAVDRAVWRLMQPFYHEFIIALLYCDSWLWSVLLSSFFLLVCLFDSALPPATVDHAAISQRQRLSPLHSRRPRSLSSPTIKWPTGERNILPL